MICIFVAQFGRANINIQNSPMACREEKKPSPIFLLFRRYPCPQPHGQGHTLQISNIYARMLSNILRKFDLIGKLRNFPNHGIQKMQIH